MISWMQRKRKYLIITIWVSTIAFIGAGFVGWGSYEYGSKATAVAKVGNSEVKMKDLQKTYSALYSQYSQYFQGKFDQKMAKQLGLEQQAMKQVVQQEMLINFAHDMDLAITDDEVLNAIYTSAAFFKDGKFDKDTYVTALKGAKLSTVDYEESLRKEMLIKKLFKLMSPEVLDLEKQTLRSAFFIADKIEYKILNAADVKVSINEDDLKKFYEAHKNEYMTQKLYEVELLWHEMQKGEYSDDELKSFYNEETFNYRAEDGSTLSFEDAKKDVINAYRAKKSKKSALLEYIDFKKGKLGRSGEHQTLSQINMQLSAEIMNELDGLNNGDILKPRISGNRFVTVKLLNIVLPRVMTFQEANSEATVKYMMQAKKEALQKEAQNELNSFKGKISEFITREESGAIDGLDSTEASDFLNKLFTQQTRRGMVELDQKIILYYILEQKLLETDQEDETEKLVEQSAQRLKQSLFDNGLFKLLEVRYPVEVY